LEYDVLAADITEVVKRNARTRVHERFKRIHGIGAVVLCIDEVNELVWEMSLLRKTMR
jgi:hypothetical protein